MECKKPSELKNRVKGNLFRDYWSIDILKQNLAAIMQTWEVVVLPLPEYTSMDHYTIPEARGVQFDENETEEVLVDDENVSEDDEEEDNEQLRSPPVERSIVLGTVMMGLILGGLVVSRIRAAALR